MIQFLKPLTQFSCFNNKVNLCKVLRVEMLSIQYMPKPRVNINKVSYQAIIGSQLTKCGPTDLQFDLRVDFDVRKHLPN